MLHIQIITKTMNGIIKRRDTYGSDNRILELLADTVGNSNGNWIDTSHYALAAVQTNTSYQPALTNDVFGIGNKGYVFEQFDSMTISDCNNLYDARSQSFTVKMKVKFANNNPANCNLISKLNGNDYEWYIILYQGQLRFVIYSGGSNSVYIRKSASFAFLSGELYSLKFTYNGDRVAANMKIYVNGIEISGSANTIGSFGEISTTTAPIYIGIKTYPAPIGALAKVEIWRGVI